MISKRIAFVIKSPPTSEGVDYAFRLGSSTTRKSPRVAQFTVAGVGPGKLDPTLGHVSENVVEKGRGMPSAHEMTTGTVFLLLKLGERR